MSTITLPIPKFNGEIKTDISKEGGVSLTELKNISIRLHKKYKEGHPEVVALVEAASAYLEEKENEKNSS